MLEKCVQTFYTTPQPGRDRIIVVAVEQSLNNIFVGTVQEGNTF